MTEHIRKYIKKRHNFTYKEKQDIINDYEKYKHKYNVTQFSKLINVKRSTLQDCIDNKKKNFFF